MSTTDAYGPSTSTTICRSAKPRLNGVFNQHVYEPPGTFPPALPYVFLYLAADDVVGLLHGGGKADGCYPPPAWLCLNGLSGDARRFR
jgi:hypothetical protein